LATATQNPCSSLGSISIPSVNLLMGIQLQAIADFSQGPPTNCALLTSLMVQLTPTLAGFTCIFKLLAVVGALQQALGGLTKVPPDFSGIPKVLSAIGEMTECLDILIPPLGLFLMIKDILLLIIEYLKCFLDAIKSILDFQVGIDLSVAQGNPDLLASLQCASGNADAAMAQLMLAVGPIGPLFSLVQTFIGFAGLSIQLPSLSAITGASNVVEAVNQMDAMLAEMQQIVAAIPG
jgi:hypothetical protein